MDGASGVWFPCRATWEVRGTATLAGSQAHQCQRKLEPRPERPQIEMPLLAPGEIAAGGSCALSCRGFAGYRGRPSTVTRTSAHVGSPQLIREEILPGRE